MVTAWPSISRFPSSPIIEGDSPASTRLPSEVTPGIPGLEAVGTGILTDRGPPCPLALAVSGSRNRLLF